MPESQVSWCSETGCWETGYTGKSTKLATKESGSWPPLIGRLEGGMGRCTCPNISHGAVLWVGLLVGSFRFPGSGAKTQPRPRCDFSFD